MSSSNAQERPPTSTLLNDMGDAEGAMIEIFEDLGNVFEHLRVNGDLATLKLKSLAAKQFVMYCAKGRSLEEAFFLVCKDCNAHLGNLFFGSVEPSHESKTHELTACDCGRIFRVILYTSQEPPLPLLAHVPKAVILCTNFKLFTFRRADEAGQISRPFAIFNAREMGEEINFTGSVLASIHPTHYAIVSRTISCTFPHGTSGALFSTETNASDDLLEVERAANRMLSCFDSPATQRFSLEALRIKMQSCSRPPKLLSEHKEGAYTLRRYSPQRSSLFDFGDPAGESSRGDFVTTYNVHNEEFHRDFFLSPCSWATDNEDLQLAAFDILHMLAIRRARLFRLSVASRVYNILLPPFLLADTSGRPNGYAIFPCLSLYRPLKGTFRRTLSITFITCPIEMAFYHDEMTGIISRPAHLEELYQLKDELLLPIIDSVVSSSLKSYRIRESVNPYFGLPKECNIPQTLRCVSEMVLRRILVSEDGCNPAIEYLVKSTLFASNHDSKTVSISLQVEWSAPKGFTQPWERWLATKDDKVFRNILFRTLFYKDYLNPYSADASRHGVDFEAFNVGNALGADMAGMTFYNPQEAVKFVLYPKAFEKYPNHSIVRWMAWQVYIDSALTSLRALIYKFHPLLEDKRDLHLMIDTLDEMIEEFVDFYDLDIRDFFYRKEYEKLRTLMQVNLDYAQLLSKLASSKENESLREQRLINKLIVSFTIATVTITIVSTIAQMGTLSVKSYLVVTVVLSTVFVWIGYVLFDPLRLGHKRLYRVIKNSFKKTNENF